MYLAANWYAKDPNCGAVYWRFGSLHWGLDGPVVYRDGRVQTLRERPRRQIVLYGPRLYPPLLTIPLWKCRAYCEHGFTAKSYWHRCDYVAADNPDGRVPDRELYPDDYDEHGVHYMDRTCFCDLKPEYSLCSMHPDDEDDE